MKATSKARLDALTLSDAQRFESLKKEIVQLDYFCKGTVLKRMMKCGNKQCACHRDPTKRHGPYLECTFKGSQQDGQFGALPRSGPALPNRHLAISQVEVPARASGTVVANCFAPSAQAGAIHAPPLT